VLAHCPYSDCRSFARRSSSNLKLENFVFKTVHRGTGDLVGMAHRVIRAKVAEVGLL
jgi:hypothetical protein